MGPHLVFGAGGIGTTATSFTYTFDTPDKVAALLDELARLGIRELDSAASYPPGNAWNAETLLGQVGAAARGFVVDTKVLVRVGADGRSLLPGLTAEHVAASLDRSLALLGAPRVRSLYAHVHDGSTPLAEQAAAFDRQRRAGKFERYGISNYAAADVAALFAVCEQQGFAKPAVYQGMYNALQRGAEAELLPLLRRHGCAFYAYSPLAGGFLTGKVTAARDAEAVAEAEAGTKAGTGAGAETTLQRTRWHGASAHAAYTRLYDQPAMHAAVRALQAACAAADPPLAPQEAAMRWLLHHSALREDLGDAVVFGAKTLDTLRANVAEARRGPLPEAVRVVVEGLWAMAGDTKARV